MNIAEEAQKLFDDFTSTKQELMEGSVKATYFDINFDAEVFTVESSVNKQIVDKLIEMLFEHFGIKPTPGWRIEKNIGMFRKGTHEWSSYIRYNQVNAPTAARYAIVVMRFIRTSIQGCFSETEVHEALYLRNTRSNIFEKKYSNELYDSRKAKRQKH
jgi:hypothetical protein